MEVDERLKPVIERLNAAGWQTWSSCQGKTTLGESEHCEHAFITFDVNLWKMRKRIRQLGLTLYNGNISVTSLDGTETPEDAVRKNLEFPQKIIQLFEIK